MAILIFRHPLKNEDYNLSIVRLYILNEKNPFIKILQSLDLHTIESLKTIEVPKFFKDLFEELEFYAAIAIPSPEERVKALILLAQQQLNAGKQNNVIRLIEKIGEAISDKEMHPIKKVAFLQELASIFIQPENQKFGVQILEEAYEAIADIALPAGKRNALKKLAESFSQFHAWNWVVKIINEILQNERPGLEHKVRAVSEIFQSIMKHADAQALLQIIPKCIKCPANDLAIVEISLNLQRDLKKDEDAVKAASLIHQDRLRAKILEEIMQKTDKMRLTDS